MLSSRMEMAPQIGNFFAWLSRVLWTWWICSPYQCHSLLQLIETTNVSHTLEKKHSVFIFGGAQAFGEARTLLCSTFALL